MVTLRRVRKEASRVISRHLVYVCMVITCGKGKDQPGKLTNPAASGQLNRENSKGKDQPGEMANPATSDQLNRENEFSLFPFAPGNLVSRDGFGCPVPH